MSIIEYKCPSCGGAITFDSTTQQMVCPYCDATFDVQGLQFYDEMLATDPQDNIDWHMPDSHWREGELDGMRVYGCKSCGGEIVGDETMAATSCLYCGNPVVIAGQFSGALRPDIVIPFKLDKDAAKNALKRHYKWKLLLPKVFREQNHIEEIKGLYIPFWLFDAAVDVNARYNATKVRSWSDSNYNYTETSHYLVSRQGDIGFESVPVDGASKMPDDLMESVEPFYLQDAVDFQTAYLTGYLADKYDVDANRCVVRANERIKKSTEAAFAGTVKGYHSVSVQSSSVHLKSGGARYALLPVWLLGTNWNGKRYMYAINGQTGQLAGDDLPVGRGAYWRWFFVFAAVYTPLIFTLLRLAVNM